MLCPELHTVDLKLFLSAFMAHLLLDVSKYYIALMQKSDVINRVDVADVGLHSQHRLVLIACIDRHIASTEGGNTTISNS